MPALCSRPCIALNSSDLCSNAQGLYASLRLSRAASAELHDMACMHAASARQLPGCSTTGRGHVQYQAFRQSCRAFRRQTARAFTASNCNNSGNLQQHSLCSKSKKRACSRVYAEPSDQEEKQLRSDYGALSERLEVSLPTYHVALLCPQQLFATGIRCTLCNFIYCVIYLCLICLYSSDTCELQSLADEVHELLQGNSLYLVGMMGSGKSTVGRLVGKALKYPLLDTDALIEQSSSSTVSEIFAEEGEEAFRDMETEVLHVSLALHALWSLPQSAAFQSVCHCHCFCFVCCAVHSTPCLYATFESSPSI